jgi:hypothetical protein
MAKDIMHEQFSEALDQVLEEYSAVFNADLTTLRAFTDIDFYKGEGDYTPYPVVSQNKANRDITIRCNTDAYVDTWEPLVCSIDDISEEESRKLYISTGVAWVGLAHMALNAKDNRDAGRTNKELLTIKRIQKAMQNTDQVLETIRELEASEKIEANLYPIEITPEELNRINRLRYGLGVSYVVNNGPEEIRSELSLQFAEELSTYFTNMGSHLINFALSWGFDKKIEPDAYKQQGISRAFHTLYFAGIRPMDVSDILRS